MIYRSQCLNLIRLLLIDNRKGGHILIGSDPAGLVGFCELLSMFIIRRGTTGEGKGKNDKKNDKQVFLHT